MEIEEAWEGLVLKVCGEEGDRSECAGTWEAARALALAVAEEMVHVVLADLERATKEPESFRGEDSRRSAFLARIDALPG